MEQILRIYNDIMQSNQENLGVYLSGTPEFLTNERIGLYSYDALRGRLEENTFLTKDSFDPGHPVIRLNPLDSNQIYQLIERVGAIYELDESIKKIINQDMIQSFLEFCGKKLGAKLFVSPRNIITSFLNLRVVLENDSSANWEELLETKGKIKPDIDENEFSENDNNSELQEFILGN